MTATLKRGANGGVALYQRIRSDIEGRILSGSGRRATACRSSTAHGDLLLRAHDGKQGFVGARNGGSARTPRRAGSFVSRPKVHSAVLQIPDLKAEVEKRGERYGYTLLERQKRDATRQDKARLEVDLRTPILALRCRHDAAKRPFALEDRLLNLEGGARSHAAGFSTVPPSAWLVDHVPWTEAEHRISASNADKAVAGALNIDEGSACLIVERRTWRNGEPITSFASSTLGRFTTWWRGSRRQAERAHLTL